MGAPARGCGRRAGDHPPRERREHGDGARRGCAQRLAAGALQDEARDRRELQAHAARRHEAGESARRCGSASRRTISSMWPMPSCWCWRRTPWSACSSRCSKAWPIISGARLLERVSNLLLYAPVCRKEHFLSAIGYLIRRLDENTGPENFLRHTFKLDDGQRGVAGAGEGFRRGVRAAARAERCAAADAGSARARTGESSG